ncbi:hypothetical protein [[Pseudomonas] boreopolis]|uniref:hypothetical protein n=1 Tax=Xanthomonas boreopolis TaxID=86183 RepID=UPI003D37040A
MSIFRHGAIALAILGLLPGCASGRGNESFESRISKLVDQTTKSERTERKAFSELESLGNQAVPYLVGHLGDMRPLAAQEISFENKASDAFEGARHYGPRTVHDALAAILNQITGQNFVFVYNGATPQEREENRDKWIEWCRSNYPDQAEICRGN